jgi:hypothetical protein
VSTSASVPAVATDNTEQRQNTELGVGVRWSSTPVRNRFDVFDSATDDDAVHSDNVDDGDPFTLVVSNRTRKEKQRQLKRALAVSPEYSNRARTGASRNQQQQQQVPRRPRGPLLVGKSSVSRLQAAKKLYKKAVFYVDNLKPTTTVNDLVTFVQQCVGVEVLTCFEVVPRRRYGDSDDADSRRATRRAFRVCIKEDDIEHFLVPGSWPESVSISAWTFRAKQEGDKRIRLDEETTTKESVAVTPSSHAVTDNTDILDATELMEETVIVGDPNQ